MHFGIRSGKGKQVLTWHAIHNEQVNRGIVADAVRRQRACVKQKYMLAAVFGHEDQTLTVQRAAELCVQLLLELDYWGVGSGEFKCMRVAG